MQAGFLHCPVCNAQLPPGQFCGCSPYSYPVPYEDLPSFRTAKTADGRWICPKCTTQNIQNATKCSNCHFVALENVPIDSSEPAANPVPPSESLPATGKFSCWTCTKCTYEHNLVDYEICNRCQAPNPRMAANVQAVKPIIEVKVEDVVFQGPCWICPKCSYGYNMREVVKCERCTFTRPIAAKKENGNSSQFPVFAPRIPWSCQCGNSGIKADSCSLCGKTKMQQVIAPQPHQLVQERYPAYSEWSCSSCGFAKNTSLQCTSCSMPKGYVCQPSNPQNMWQCTCSSWNLLNAGFCHQCRSPKPVPPREVEINVKIQLGIQGWICHSCSTENSIETNRCQHCKLLNEVATGIRSLFSR